jgi:hypothetical protein
VLAVFGALVLAYVGIQPPNEKVIYVIAALLVLLLGIWYLGGVRKSFSGPPVGGRAKGREHALETIEGQLE